MPEHLDQILHDHGVWTPALERRYVQAQQRPAPPLGTIVRNEYRGREVVLAWLRAQPAGRSFSCLQVVRATDKQWDYVYHALQALVGDGHVEKIDTRNCTRDGARFLYALRVR